MSWTLSGLFLVAAVNQIDRPRKRKGPIGKISGKSQEAQKGTNNDKKGKEIGKPRRLKAPV